jgi:hypothetical protein
VVKLVDFDNRWATAMGRVFIAFGSMEHTLVVSLRTITKGCIQRTTASMRFGQRIDMLRELLEPYPGAACDKFGCSLLRAKELAQKRNVIAHNPLMLSFYESPESGISKHETIYSAQKEKHLMTYGALEALVSAAESLAEELYGDGSAALREIEGQPSIGGH